MRHIFQTGCLIFGILCFLYYTVIGLYVGFVSDFAWIWVLGGGFFLGLARMLSYQTVHPGHWIRLISGGMILLLAVGILVILLVGSRIVSKMTAQPKYGLDYVLVLGAQVKGTEPSRALRKRLDRALAYAAENPDTIFILSGGKGSDEEISEAECMYRYLTGKGLSAERMLLEDQSTSTWENMQFSAAYLNPVQDQIGILSNNFHIYRALLLAKRAGYQNVCGIPAASDALMQPHYVLREICAVLVMMCG